MTSSQSNDSGVYETLANSIQAAAQQTRVAHAPPTLPPLSRARSNVERAYDLTTQVERIRGFLSIPVPTDGPPSIPPQRSGILGAIEDAGDSLSGLEFAVSQLSALLVID